MPGRPLGSFMACTAPDKHSTLHVARIIGLPSEIFTWADHAPSATRRSTRLGDSALPTWHAIQGAEAEFDTDAAH
jgi:hypothetical protein